MPSESNQDFLIQPFVRVVGMLSQLFWEGLSLIKLAVFALFRPYPNSELALIMARQQPRSSAHARSAAETPIHSYSINRSQKRDGYP